MKTILTLANKIKACTLPLENILLPAEWNELDASLATLENTGHALQFYEKHGLAQNFEPSFTGEAYLRLYGTLQAVFLQQEAIRGLHRSLIGEDLKPEDGTAWHQIRRLRNESVAHPIKLPISEKGTRHYTISKHLFGGKELMLVYWDSKEQKVLTEIINLPILYTLYKTEAVTNIERVLAAPKCRDVSS